MAKRDPRLQLRGRVWHVRVKVPAEIRTAGGIAKREFRRSLKTTDLAEARRLLPFELIQIDAEIANARRLLSREPVAVLTRSEMEHLALEWFRREDATRSKATASSADRTEDHSGDEIYEDLRQWADILRHPDSVDCSTSVMRAMQVLLRGQGIDIVVTHPALQPLRELIRRGLLEQTRRSIRLLDQDYSVTTGDAFFDQHAAGADVKRVAPRMTVDELIKRYNAEPSRKALAPKSRLKADAQGRLIREVFGANTPAADITRAAVADFVDLLTRMPANATKRFPGKSTQAAADAAAAKGLAPMSRLSAKAYLAALASLLAFAISRGVRSDNPTDRFSVGRDGVAARDRRHPFSADQLTKIFNAPLYRGSRDDGSGYAIPGLTVTRRGRFWVPLISLFTGMRLQEIAQLHVSDIAQIDGVDVIIVQVDEAGVKRIKTAAGHRFVPVHPELRRIGLMAYHVEIKRRGESRLFPELTAAKASGYLSDNFSKWFSNFLASADAKGPRTSFHSFRHCYRDALRNADISLERVRALGGWSSGRTEEAYGSGIRASTLARDIERISYDGLNLRHLYSNTT